MKIPYYNLVIDSLSKCEVLECIRKSIREGQQININFLNAHCFNIAQKCESYKASLDESDLLLNDGIGVDIGAWLIGFKFKENLNGTDLIPEILAESERCGFSIFLLGATPEVIEAAKSNIASCYQNLNIVGILDGYTCGEQFVINRINSSQAQIVIIGMGVPKQELWVAKNRDELKSVNVLICGGAIFDFLSGRVPRAPSWMRAMKIEWVFRLYNEPRRLFTRYVFGNFKFIFHLFNLKRRGFRRNSTYNGER